MNQYYHPLARCNVAGASRSYASRISLCMPDERRCVAARRGNYGVMDHARPRLREITQTLILNVLERAA
jgi:hypothetical protein